MNQLKVSNQLLSSMIAWVLVHGML